MDSQVLDAIKSRVKVMVPYTLKPYKAKIKVNQNESPHDLPNEIKSVILTRVQQMNWARYPDYIPTTTIEKLARFAEWSPDGILIGNGSNEMIQDLLTVTVDRGRKVLIQQPTFTLYKLIATVLGGTIFEVPLSENLCYDLDATMKTVQKAKPDLVIFASPNNPTGCIITQNELEEVLKTYKGLVIVDEAYHEFSGQTALNLLHKFDNLILIRSFSNAFSMAGLRLGYLLAQPQIIEQIAKAKLPYNVNIVSLTAAEVILENLPLVQDRIRYIIRERKELYQRLTAIPNIKAYPSHANFIVFETNQNPETVFNDLLQRNILVRDVSYYPRLNKALRVTVGTPEENNTFLEALKEIVASR